MFVYFGDDDVVTYTINCKPHLAPAGSKIEVPDGTVVNPGSDTVVDGVHVPYIPDAAEILLGLRQEAFLTRREFCLSLAQAGVLTGPDAIAAAKGEWPVAMADFLTYLDENQSLDAQIEWAATAQIDRLHPFVLSLGSWLGLTDAQVDTLFGIEAPV